MNTEVKLATPTEIEDLANKIRIASSKIMMSKYTKLIGVALYRFKLKIDDNHSILGQNGLACVCWHKSKDEFKIVPNIWFSPLLHSWSIPEISFVLIHEILHTLDRHQSRLGVKHARLWNLACDHVINRRIKQDIDNGNNIVSCPDSIFIVDEWVNKDLIAEEVYDRLLDEAETGETIIESNGGGEEESSNDDIKPSDNIIVTRKGKKYKLNPDLSGDSNGESESEEEVKDIKTIIRGALKSDVFKQIGIGTKTGGIIEFLKDIVEVKIPWYTLLEKAIHKHMPIKSDNRSWRVINKRMRSHGLMLPYNDIDTKIDSNLYIVVDNSGSIRTEELRKFASIIVNSAGFFNNVIIFKHDVEIKEILEFNNEEGIMDVENAIKGVGRGGTSHTPVFNEIEKRVVTNQDTDEVGLVLILTDYDSDIEQIWSDYEWVKTIPVKIVLTDPRNVASMVDDSPILISDVGV